MKLPAAALLIMEQLNHHGYEAYAVGGAVRDMLCNATPTDIDITTCASPEEVMTVFKDYSTIPTGLAHGTVTVLVDRVPYEITTYRTDGVYSDGRHPDNVLFTASLTEDLARRDFTVNAMAYHPSEGIVDPFGGMQDLQNKQLRCVGDPIKRFTEDALRIARLVRFMSVLDFTVDDATLQAAHKLCERLDLVAAERKRVELTKCLLGNGFYKAAMTFPDVMAQIIPPLSACIGFHQQTPYHAYDVYEHTVLAVSNARFDLTVRLALLLHDIGKPHCFTVDEQNIGHFYRHASVSHDIAEQALKALRFDNATARNVLELVKHHDLPIEADKKQLKRLLNRFGDIGLQRLLAVKTADAAACHPDRIPPDFSKIQILLKQIHEDNECISLKDLKVNGDDLLALGIPKGPQLGIILQDVLEAVLAEQLPNKREPLITYIKERWMS